MKNIFVPLMLLAAAAAMAQNRLPTMPGAKDAAANRAKLRPALQLASLQARWVDDNTVAWRDGEEWVLFDASTGKESRTVTSPHALRAAFALITAVSISAADATGRSA